MKYVSFDNKKDIELKSCPFCGGIPKVDHIGNDVSTVRKIVIKCSTCQSKRVDASKNHDFEWLENVSSNAWNQRQS